MWPDRRRNPIGQHVDRLLPRELWHGRFSLERPQEINDFLLILSSQTNEKFDDLICLAAIALVISDGFHQAGRPSIMEKEQALTQAPQGCRAELIRPGAPLRDPIREFGAHAMEEEIRMQSYSC